MSHDPSTILRVLSIREPLIGVYDAPDPTPFAPLTEPAERECVFAALERWRRGETLHLTRERHGCGARQLLGVDQEKWLFAEMQAAARRGVRVQLMLPARCDVQLLITAARSFYETLMSAGVEVYERQNVILHAKSMVIDGRTTSRLWV